MKALRRWFETTGIKQSDFGKDHGVAQATVSDWLMGKTTPTPKKLLKISKSTGIPVTKLLRDCADDELAREVKKTA